MMWSVCWLLGLLGILFAMAAGEFKAEGKPPRYRLTGFFLAAVLIAAAVFFGRNAP